MRQKPMDRWIETAEAHRVRLMAQQMSGQSIAPPSTSVVKKFQSIVRLQISHCQPVQALMMRLAG